MTLRLTRSRGINHFSSLRPLSSPGNSCLLTGGWSVSLSAYALYQTSIPGAGQQQLLVGTAVPLQSVYCGGAALLLPSWQEFSVHALKGPPAFLSSASTSHPGLEHSSLCATAAGCEAPGTRNPGRQERAACNQSSFEVHCHAALLCSLEDLPIKIPKDIPVLNCTCDPSV
eukprot:500511-Rhodomonas_salina.1